MAMTNEEKRSRLAERLSGANLQHNGKIVFFCRILVSVIAGVACGILGLTNLWGVLLYAFSSLVLTACIALKANFKVENYFNSIWSPMLAGLSQGIMSFVLFWTLIYDIVHIY